MCQKSSSVVSGVFREKNKKKCRIQICFARKRHILGYFDSKEAAIMKRVETEKKCFDPVLDGNKEI